MQGIARSGSSNWVHLLAVTDRGTGFTSLWAYISCARCTSVCVSCPVIGRRMNSLTRLLLYLARYFEGNFNGTLQTQGAFFIPTQWRFINANFMWRLHLCPVGFYCSLVWEWIHFMHSCQTKYITGLCWPLAWAGLARLQATRQAHF